MKSAPTVPWLLADVDHILSHTRDFWDEIGGKRIFVTGGTGFFGRWLLESFAYANCTLNLGAEMVVLSRNPAAFANKAPMLAADPAISFVPGDVRSLSSSAFQSTRFDFVIHAATDSGTKSAADDSLLVFDTIVQGTRSLLEFACAVGAKRLLFTSSGAVYGPQPDGVTHVSEESGSAPTCDKASAAYAEGKRAAELLCAIYADRYGIQTTIARCFAFVGPFLSLDQHFAIGNFILDGMEGRPIRINGDGSPFRSYLHAADLMIWLWLILFKGVSCRPYNVGSEDGRSIREIAELVARLTDAPGVSIAKEPVPGVPASRYVPLCRRAHEELGLEQWISLEPAIKRTLDALKEQTAEQLR
jgi:nucleoside-diphosphate-sugar epimerase